MTTAEELAELKRKRAARKGKGGYAQNLIEIEARIAELEALAPVYRDNATGQFVTAEYAAAHPDTTSPVEAV